MDFQSSVRHHFLVAVPSMRGTYFEQAVVYVCEHQSKGTAGLIINHPMEASLGLIFEQLHLEQVVIAQKNKPLLMGGPIQPERGFVIHRPFGQWQSSLRLDDDVTITTSNDIIRAMASDHGPQDVLVTLGFVGWQPGQLEKEIMDDQWLICPYDSSLLYNVDFDKRWNVATQMMGVNMNHFISGPGHA